MNRMNRMATMTRGRRHGRSRERPEEKGGTAARDATVAALPRRFLIPDKQSGRFQPIRAIAVPTGSPRRTLNARGVLRGPFRVRRCRAIRVLPDGAVNDALGL